ncbi:HNH endonuclease domain-containing protein [Mycoplasmopsis felis]
MIPKSRCGGDNQDNLVICRIETNEEKADRTSLNWLWCWWWFN